LKRPLFLTQREWSLKREDNCVLRSELTQRLLDVATPPVFGPQLHRLEPIDVLYKHKN